MDLLRKDEKLTELKPEPPVRRTYIKVIRIREKGVETGSDQDKFGPASYLVRCDQATTVSASGKHDLPAPSLEGIRQIVFRNEPWYAIDFIRRIDLNISQLVENVKEGLGPRVDEFEIDTPTFSLEWQERP